MSNYQCKPADRVKVNAIRDPIFDLEQSGSNERNIMKHVGLGFAQKTNPSLLTWSESVHAAFVANPTVVTDCPVTAAQLDTGNKDFSAKMAAMQQGGKQATKDRDASREALLALHYQIAAWLEGKAQGDGDMITLLCYEVTEHGYTPQTPCATPAITAIINNMTTQLQLRVSAVANANSFEVQYRIGTGAWTGAGTYTNSRSIVVTGLVPGTMYEFRVRAIGGSTGYSDWSDSVSHMCM